MSTTPQLSPLEQLEQQTQHPANQPQDGLSPLERLEQQSQHPANHPQDGLSPLERLEQGPNTYENPFDRPLQSELDEHKAAQAKTVAASPIGNPFDEPLASEKAEAAHATAMKSSDGIGNPFDRPLASEIEEQKQKQAQSGRSKMSYMQQALHPEGDVQNPMQPAESFALAHPEEQGKLAAASAVGAGGAALTEVAPAVVSGLVENAKNVYEWAKANPVKAAALEGIAREIGIDPFQLAHKVVKYGKGLFGDGK